MLQNIKKYIFIFDLSATKHLLDPYSYSPYKMYNIPAPTFPLLLSHGGIINFCECIYIYIHNIFSWIVEHKDMDWKRARRCIGIVRVSARSLILCGLRAATYSRVLAIHKL